MSSKEYLFCGKSLEFEDKYTRRGNSLECMKKGYGSALHRNDSEAERQEYIRKYNYLPKRIISPEEDRKYGKIDLYRKFLTKHFETAKRTSRDLKKGDIFTQLSILWRDEYEHKDDSNESDDDSDEKYNDDDDDNQKKIKKDIEDIKEYDRQILQEIEEIEALFLKENPILTRMKEIRDIKKKRRLTEKEKSESRQLFEKILTQQMNIGIQKVRDIFKSSQPS